MHFTSHDKIDGYILFVDILSHENKIEPQLPENILALSSCILCGALALTYSALSFNELISVVEGYQMPLCAKHIDYFHLNNFKLHKK